MTIKNKFEIGQTVYLVTDPEQMPNIVTGINIKPGNRLTYDVCFMSNTNDYYDFELSAEKNVLTACGVEENSKN